MKRIGIIAAWLVAVCGPAASAQQKPKYKLAQPEEETLEEIEIEEASPFKDAFHLRMSAGAAYARAFTRYEPTQGSTGRESLEASSPALSLEAGVGARVGRDVSLGLTGGVVHGPLTRLEGSWRDDSQGEYYGLFFIDHHFPHQRVIHLGAAIGAGYVHSLGPSQEGYGGFGPAGQAFFGFDLRMAKTVRFGVLGTLTVTSIRQSHSISGPDYDFDTFFVALGAAFTVRVSDFKFPTSLPTLARAPAHRHHD